MLRCKRIARQTNLSGFTLLELLISIALLAIFFGGVYETVIVGLRVVHASDTREELRGEAINAFERFTREACLAKTVRQATASVFEFDADLNADGTAETNIIYQVLSGDFVRTYGGTTTILVKDWSSSTFSYLKQDRVAWVSGTDALSTIRVVQATLTAAKNTETISLTNASYLRSM